MLGNSRNSKSNNKTSKHSKNSKEKNRAIDQVIKTNKGRASRLYDSATTTLKDGNYLIPLMVVIISIFGVVMVFSAGYYETVNMTDPDPLYYLKKQGFFVITGLIIMMIVSTIDYHKYAKYANLLIAISILLLILVFPLGSSANGATRWIGVAGFNITPSELSKLAVIIFTSVYLAQDPSRIKTPRGLLTLLGVIAAHFLLIVAQPNLSTAIVIVILIAAIMFAAGLAIKWIFITLIAGATGATFILLFMKDSHWYARLTNWVDPFADSQGAGYQVSQSLIALGNGGLKGLGLGNSISKNLYLPEPTNDFILAIIGEELGFIGLLLLMIFYLLFVFVLIMTAMNAKDKLGMYLATGVAVMLGVQVAINVAVCTASMPATGITLPFVSYGGTSIWIFMAAMGIALNVSKGCNKPNLFKRSVIKEGKK